MAMQGHDVLSLALTSNAVVAVCQASRPRNCLPFWQLMILDRKDGSVMSRTRLPSEPIPGALAITRNGSILVTLQDGGLVCYGKSGG